MTDRYPSPRALLEKYGLRAKKSWGQNFLGDEADPRRHRAARRAARRRPRRRARRRPRAPHRPPRRARRAGRRGRARPGHGAVLRGELGEAVTLVEADAARLDYAELARRYGAPTANPTSTSTANPPSTAPSSAWSATCPTTSPRPSSSPLLDQVEAVSRAVFLLQREVAERLAAAPGTRDWGILSVLLQREADVSIERIVPPGAFLPPPKVDSAVLCALFRPPGRCDRRSGAVPRLVKAGFAQRRKTLGNALKAARIVEPEALAAALAQAGVDPGRRGETLTVARVGRPRPGAGLGRFRFGVAEGGRPPAGPPGRLPFHQVGQPPGPRYAWPREQVFHPPRFGFGMLGMSGAASTGAHPLSRPPTRPSVGRAPVKIRGPRAPSCERWRGGGSCSSRRSRPGTSGTRPDRAAWRGSSVRTMSSYAAAFGFLSSRAILRMARWKAGSIPSSLATAVPALPFVATRLAMCLAPPRPLTRWCRVRRRYVTWQVRSREP